MEYIEGESTDPAFNLAMEEHLYRSLKEGAGGYFLLWRNKPSIIVGRFQNTAQEVNRAYLDERAIPAVRRISGGGTVYHDLGNLNYTFIVHNTPGESLDFTPLALPVVRTLKGLGVEAEFNGRNDLTIGGRKFSGAAQHMDHKRLLHHGTLLFDSDLSVLGEALTADREKFTSKGFDSVRSRVTNIKPHLPSPLSMEEFMEKLKETMDWASPRLLTEEERRSIIKLRDEKYSSWEWNWGESPEYTERKERRFPWGKVEALLKVKEGLVSDVHFFGDFFGEEERGDLQALLRGCPLRAEDLQERLTPFPLDRFFRGASVEEFVKFLTT